PAIFFGSALRLWLLARHPRCSALWIDPRETLSCRADRATVPYIVSRQVLRQTACMLALTDAALARICISASRVSRARRKRWLREIAARLDPPRSIMRSRERSRRARVRKRNGKAVLRVEVDHDPLLLALIESGRMSEAETADLRRVEAVVGKMLREWAEHWQQALR